MAKCFLCPRECGIDRSVSRGYCGESDRITISRASLHMWEEPSISGTRGSGTIFFCGCNLGCVFCQNALISRGGGVRREISESELCDIMLELEGEGAHNINLVTPTHFSDSVARSLEAVREKLSIPIVYNTSAYESLSSLKRLEGLVDIYLPDFKYAQSELAAAYSNAPDYPETALLAISEMLRQTGKVRFGADGILMQGTIIRHLVLPACRHDSIAALDLLASEFDIKQMRLSLMSQYTPEFALGCEHKNLHRRVTSFEYDSVLKHAISLGFEGYFQHPSSATSSYTPDFSK